MNTKMHLMMKCDMCYDRTSVGLKPWCASVCPSQALAFGTREEMEKLRPHARPTNTFAFGSQTIRTKVNLMVPLDAPQEVIDVTAAMHEPTTGHDVLDDVFSANLYDDPRGGA
jgi:Fe-S-cluster-containing dehydrogenase component